MSKRRKQEKMAMRLVRLALTMDKEREEKRLMKLVELAISIKQQQLRLLGADGQEKWDTFERQTQGVEKELAAFEPESIAPLLLNVDWKIREVAEKALADMGEKALPVLNNALESRHVFVAISAVNALMGMKYAALPSLIRALEHKEADVRDRAVDVLSRLCDEEATNALEKALKDCNVIVRRSAAKALERITGRKELQEATEAGSMDDLRELIAQLGEEHEQSVEMKLNYAIADYEEKSVPELIQALEGNERTCNRAATALGLIGEKASAAVPALIKALCKKDGRNKLYVADALESIGESAVKEVMRAQQRGEIPYEWANTIIQSINEKLGKKGVATGVRKTPVQTRKGRVMARAFA